MYRTVLKKRIIKIRMNMNSQESLSFVIDVYSFYSCRDFCSAIYSVLFLLLLLFVLFYCCFKNDELVYLFLFLLGE
jgi:hypothetical protein